MVWCSCLCLGCGKTLRSRLPGPDGKGFSYRGGECETPPEKGRQKSPPGHLPYNGVSCITHLCCQLKVLRRHKVLIQVKPTTSTPRESNNLWRALTKFFLGHLFAKKFWGAMHSQRSAVVVAQSWYTLQTGSPPTDNFFLRG